MSRAQVEEVSDSDIASDPEEVDLDDFDDTEIIRRVPDQTAAPRPSAAQQQPMPMMPGIPASNVIPASADQSAYADFQCLYPVYFDASRSRAEGRRVSASLAVHNPLAREIATACSRLRLPTLFEPEKYHPKDWANPGRVKVGLRKTNTPAVTIHNKHHLYVLVAKHLQQNPTTENSMGLRVRMGGQLQPEEGKPYPRPAVPRGWKMGELLPYLSPAMTGGGVSENLFKDMMKEMQGGGDPMAALMGGAAGGMAPEEGGKKKKDKKGKGKA
ncbi:signal recognition particle, SRP19 subunit [Stachybotrys elegans]|uniref:Signal recognition particle, SRP19 subunit n=1 Tax=Stachybotrys elegans TaxID=80388 RepID=A0A8K0WSU5_9HYPO|nr:signal recognition particle, SRP19 subunit [Stachybotrys elegans]